MHKNIDINLSLLLQFVITVVIFHDSFDNLIQVLWFKFEVSFHLSAFYYL